MVTRRVELTDEQNEVLERLAASEGRSVSELIRAGVEVILSEGDARYLFQIEPRGSEQPRASPRRNPSCCSRSTGASRPSPWIATAS